MPLACFISSLPTPVLPVKLILRILGSVVNVSPTSGVFFIAVTKLTTPLGIPARRESSASALAVKGVSPGDLATTVQPAARAGPILRVIMAAGKFHGVMRPQTPTGWRIARTRFVGVEEGTTSPWIWAASSLNHRKKLAAYWVSPFASARGFPFYGFIALASELS